MNRPRRKNFLIASLPSEEILQFQPRKLGMNCKTSSGRDSKTLTSLCSGDFFHQKNTASRPKHYGTTRLRNISNLAITCRRKMNQKDHLHEAWLWSHREGVDRQAPRGKSFRHSS